MDKKIEELQKENEQLKARNTEYESTMNQIHQNLININKEMDEVMAIPENYHNPADIAEIKRLKSYADSFQTGFDFGQEAAKNAKPEDAERISTQMQEAVSCWMQNKDYHNHYDIEVLREARDGLDCALFWTEKHGHIASTEQIKAAIAEIDRIIEGQ